MPEKKVFEVHIEQGHKYGAKVVLRGEAGMSELGVLPGDVIFVLEPKPHKTFKRVGNDLILDKVPSLHCYCPPEFDGVMINHLLMLFFAHAALLAVFQFGPGGLQCSIWLVT